MSYAELRHRLNGDKRLMAEIAYHHALQYWWRKANALQAELNRIAREADRTRRFPAEEEKGGSTPSTRTSGGVELTDELIQKLADEAERGYDLSKLKPRRRRQDDQDR